MQESSFSAPTAEIIFQYFPELSNQQKQQFLALKKSYEEWNAKINVISRKDFEYFYERHVLHSLAIAKFIQFVPGTKILDVGTGGGFPGVPLAILFPECKFVLVDSIGKKIKVVNEVVHSIGLNNVQPLCSRVETITEKFDFIISRAVTSLPEFYGWIKNSVSKTQNNFIQNGVLYLKGGDLSNELKDFEKQTRIIALSSYFSESFFETKKLVYLSI